MANSNPEPGRSNKRTSRDGTGKPATSAGRHRDPRPAGDAARPPVTVRRMALPTDPRLPWLLTGLLSLLFIGALIWGIGQRDSGDDAQATKEALTRELAQVRAGANATAYALVPTKDGPADARGTAFYALTGSGMLQVAGLPAPAAGRRYQLWYYPAANQQPIPGGTFTLDAQGIGFILIPSDVGPFTALGISLEPEKGSQQPTGPLLLTGTVNGARG